MAPELLKSFLAGSILMMLVGLLLAALTLGMWLAALVHCLKYRHDKDRIVWVLVTLFGGPLGALIYFAIGRPGQSAPITPSATPPEICTTSKPGFNFDHKAMADSKLRAQAISDALWADANSRREKRS